MVTPASSWEKFQLLLWKNCILQWTSKWSLAFETLLPLVYLSLVLLLRFIAPEIVREPAEFEDISLNSFHNEFLKNQTKGIYYSPWHPILHDIIKTAVEHLNLESFEAFDNAGALESALLNDSYGNVGVQFDESVLNSNEIPYKFSFAIRQNAPRTTWLKNRLFRYIEDYPSLTIDDGRRDVGYVNTGFITIQNAISMAYIKLAKRTKQVELPEIVLHRFPLAKRTQDELISMLQFMLPLVLVLCFVYPAGVLVKNITVEKEKQLKELMKMMGLPNWIHWSAWFMRAFIPWSISAILICVVLKIPNDEGRSLLTNTNVFALLAFLLIYVAVAICYCFMFAIFFERPTTAAAVGSCIWFIQYAPFLIYKINGAYDYKKWICLLPNSALGVGIELILQYELTGEGLQWHHFFKSITPDDDALCIYVGFMLLSALMFLILCLYIEQIFPGAYGVPKKWYFIFLKNYWFGEKDLDNYTENSALNSTQQNAANFEPEPIGKNAGLKVRNLRKKFGNKLAVKNLSFNMYEDEITVLLGHNGAGKTTTISMICGMFPPTAGTAIVNGYNISTNTEEARASMGICPQHNVLFDEMSVANHIVFFSRLKGVRGKEHIQAEVKQYLKILGFENKANEKAKNLSGGMKRKLSMCCAFCGNTKVVLCDEPSSGMDPASRRELWDLMQAEKAGRTILLTTHFMDEADALGDRIAIMCGGELKCYGSAFFLKKKYGSGYRLICVKQQNCEEKAITRQLQQFIPHIKPESDIGAELSYLLPEEYLPDFEEMLAALEENSEKLNLNGYGIGISSMEEVFMKVGAETLKNLPSTSYGGTVNEGDIENQSAFPASDLFFGNEKLHKGFNLFLNQLLAMFLKHAILTWRNKFAFLAQFLVSLAIILLVLEQPSSNDHSASDTIFIRPIHLGLKQYSEETTILELPSRLEKDPFAMNIRETYKATVNSYGDSYRLLETDGKSFADYIAPLEKTDKLEFDRKYLTAATLNDSKITAWFNFQAYHSAPLSVNLVHNALAKTVLGSSAEIIVTNAPLPLKIESNNMTWDNEITAFMLYKMILFIMCFITSFYVGPPLKERTSRVKLLQFVSGVGIWLYWITQWLWDLTMFLIIIIANLVTIACFQIIGFSTFNELGLLFILLLCFGISAIPLAYIISLITKQPATGFSRSFSLSVFSGLILYLVYSAQEGSKYSVIFLNIARIFPHFSLAVAIGKLQMNSKEVCGTMEKSDLACQLTRHCCDTILPELLYLLITGYTFLFIAILNEYKFVEKFAEMFRNIFRENPGVVYAVSEDVEVTRTNKLSKDELLAYNLVVDSATKFYGSFKAVDRVSFEVKGSECFGLLGVNGAGKTTIFKMLTGEELLTFGDIYVKGLSIKHDLSSVYKETGYCPQFDALINDLTGRETLRIFCLLRGVHLNQINGLIMGLSEAFGFTKHLDKFTVKYSGGNKRKLSTALAVLGSPSVIYLDEPTSGMDPAARRQLWNMVSRIRDSGKSIVLTSHSMEECEALCTRLAIMVNGEFKCIGSTQHLKNQYSKGLILKLKIKRTSNAVSRSSTRSPIASGPFISSGRNKVVGIVKEFVELQFPNSELHEEFQDVLTFHIPLVNVKWSQIFGIMERNRQQLNIEDYSISQTTLEEIFLDFAKLQREDRRLNG